MSQGLYNLHNYHHRDHVEDLDYPHHYNPSLPPRDQPLAMTVVIVVIVAFVLAVIIVVVVVRMCLATCCVADTDSMQVRYLIRWYSNTEHIFLST